ncbi:MAG: 2-oxo acid dehydrogenase subunit E2 [Deltaproteobacteria bacterium]|nr:2-oxo acid dehydrogenase subunit E2 [Deltaproteobacteria bacterium]
MAENVESASVLSILVSVGDQVERDQTLIEFETDKATVELPSPCAGRITSIQVSEGDDVQVGASLLEIDEGAASSDTATPTPEEAPASTSVKKKEEEKEAEPAPTPAATQKQKPPTSAGPTRSGSSIPASPFVRRLARDLGIDLSRVEGSGLGGRITREDITRHGRERIEQGPGPSAPKTPPLPDFSQWGAIERSTMTGIRRITAERMSNAWTTIPHVTHFEKADITQLEATRRKLAPRVAEKGGKLSVTAIALKVVASALKLFPNFNASLDVEHGEIVTKSYINLGLAVDTPKGLVVPVLRNVDQMNIAEIAVSLNQISAKARAGKISLKELSGGTFTVSNLGGLGTHHFSPIINWPEVAILGLGRASEEMAVIDGEGQARLMLPLSLSYDHRLIDGADAARFVSWVCEALENSFLLTLEG